MTEEEEERRTERKEQKTDNKKTNEERKETRSLMIRDVVEGKHRLPSVYTSFFYSIIF